jgi:serine/threonine protein kinase
MSEDRFQPGKLFVHFRIVRLIGQGGMGAVYEAEHEFTQRRVALKVIHTHRASTGDFRDRMVQEARALADLSHPNVVTLYDANMTEDGTVWLATEYLEGQTLRDLCRRFDSLPVRDALTYLIETCDGVAAAHELGIIHRDLKPENVFVTRQGSVKVLDFGAAKVRDRGQVRSTDIVAAGGRRSIIGTPEYMSPEHLGGHRVDERTDIFALGNIGYEMLHKHPHSNDDGSLPEMIEMCRRQVYEVPRTLATAAPHLPAVLSPIFERALHKDPNARHARVADLAADLRAALRECSQTLVSAERPPFAPRWVGPGSYQAHGPKFSLPQHEPVAVPSKPVVVRDTHPPSTPASPRTPADSAVPTDRPAGAATDTPTAESPAATAPTPRGQTIPLSVAAPAAPASSVRAADTPRSYATPVFSKTEELAPIATASEDSRHTTQPVTVLRSEQARSLRGRRYVLAGALGALALGAVGAVALSVTRAPTPALTNAVTAGPAPPALPAPDSGAPNDSDVPALPATDTGPGDSPLHDNPADAGAGSVQGAGARSDEPTRGANATKTAPRQQPSSAHPLSSVGSRPPAAAKPVATAAGGLPFAAPKN